MSLWRERIGGWLNRAERRAITDAEYESEVDGMIDRLGQHRNHTRAIAQSNSGET